MIGTISIKVNAAKPNFPLQPLFAFQGSPSSIRILDVPKSIGNWAITTVKVAVEYPDNTTVEKVAVRNGSVWVATLEGCEIAGKVLNGYSVLADGKDEDGNEVSGYVLGKGDVFILENDTELSRLVGKIAVRYLDDIPDVPTKGDLMNSNGELRLFDGNDWIVISTTEPPPVYDAQITIQKNGTPVGTFTVNTNEPKTIDIPVPSNTSDLVNDSGFITVEAIPSDISSFNNDVGYITASALPTKVSELENDSGFITLAQVPTPSYIEDANGNKVEADLDCITQDLTLPWTLVDGADTYTLNYDEQSGKWLYEEAETKKIELTYTSENSLWELAFYVWNNGEWQYNTGSTTTQEEDATSLSILEWTLTRSILKNDKLVTQTGGVEKLVEDASDEHATRVVVDEYDNVLVQKYTTGWYVSKIEVAFGASTDYTETNDYYAYLTDVSLDTEAGRLYFTPVAQDKQRNLSPYKKSGYTTNYSTGEFIAYSSWTSTQTGGQAITLHLTVTNAETPVWVNIARLVPDSAKWSGLFDTQITPKGQFLTPTQVKPYSAILGYASRAQGSLFMFGRTGMLTPDENHFVTIDYNVGKLCYVGQEQYPWELSMYNGTTFDPPIQMRYQYWTTVAYKVNGRIRNMPLNSYAWLGIRTVDTRNTRPCYILGIENEYGTIVPDNNFYDGSGTSYPITFSANNLSIETIEGVEGGITCTRQGTGTHQTELKYVAYEDSVPTKTSDLTNDSGFITASQVPPVPSNLSEYNNDVGFITASAIPSNVSQLNNDAGYLTASSSAFTAKRDKTDLVYKVGFDKDNLDKVVKFVVQYVDGNNQNVTATLDEYDEFTQTWTGDNTNWKVYTYLVGMESELYFSLDDGTAGQDAQPAPSQGAEDTSWNFTYNSNPATWTMVMTQNIALQQDFKNLRDMKDISYPASVDSTGMYTIQKFNVNGTEVANFTTSGSTSTWDTNDPVVNQYEISTTDGTNFTLVSGGIQIGTFTMTNLKNGVVDVTYDGNTYTVGAMFKQTTFALKDYVDANCATYSYVNSNLNVSGIGCSTITMSGMYTDTTTFNYNVVIVPAV